MQCLQHRPACGASTFAAPHCRPQLGSRLRRVLRCRAEEARGNGASVSEATGSTTTSGTATTSSKGLDKDLDRFTRQTAATFAPRSSTAVKNPAVRGSALYNVFEVQAWVALVVGGLLSFNVIFPTDDPSIPRLMGMWSTWMFTIPSLRARECAPREKEALNYLFLLVPLINVTLPLVWKSFPFIFVADVAAMAGMYAYKGVWAEVYGLPIGAAVSAAVEEPQGQQEPQE